MLALFVSKIFNLVTRNVFSTHNVRLDTRTVLVFSVQLAADPGMARLYNSYLKFKV